LNPAVRQTLAEVAEIARAEEEYWQAETARHLPQVWNVERRSLMVKAIPEMPVALQRRLVRAAAESLGLSLDFRHVEDIRKLVLSDVAQTSRALPGGWLASLTRAEIAFVPQSDIRSEPFDYQYQLPIPGSVNVPEAGLRLEALVIGGQNEGYNPDHLMDPALLSKQVVVRNWQPGDRFWAAHSKAPKKVKELLQKRHLAASERKAWPVAVDGGEVVWLRGFAVCERIRLRTNSGPAICIREVSK
jgi:tRNA(Ile)-lysidine synthase